MDFWVKILSWRRQIILQHFNGRLFGLFDAVEQVVFEILEVSLHKVLIHEN